MTTRVHFARLAGGVLVVSLALGPPALAQQRGTTSGPAAGTPVVPSTTAQKQSPADPAASGQPGTAAATQQGAVGVGAPGVPAKSGSEGGSSSAPGSGKRP